MNRKPVTSSMSVQAMAAAVALGLTGFVLAGVDALAQQRTVSPHAQVVQLERVVVTGQRLARTAPASQRVGANGLNSGPNSGPCNSATHTC